MNKFIILIMILLSMIIYNMDSNKPVYKEEFTIILIKKINKKTKKWRF